MLQSKYKRVKVMNSSIKGEKSVLMHPDGSSMAWFALGMP